MVVFVLFVLFMLLVFGRVVMVIMTIAPFIFVFHTPVASYCTATGECGAAHCCRKSDQQPRNSAFIVEASHDHLTKVV